MATFEAEELYDDPALQLTALRAWWHRHNKVFSTFWLVGCTAERQVEILRRSAPLMPRINSAARPQQDRSATDLILPELAEDALTAQRGRLLVMLLARRLAPAEIDVFDADVKFLTSLMAASCLPALDRGKFAGLDLPFVVPSEADPEVRAMSPDAAPALRQSVLDAIEARQIVRAEVWLALCARREALTDFIHGVVTMVEMDLAAIARAEPDGVNPIVPDFKSLYRAEAALLKLDAEVAKYAALEKVEAVDKAQATAADGEGES